MRVSTAGIFEAASTRLSDLQSRLMRTQEQIATGRRILAPSDDPVASAEAFDLSQSKSVNLQFGVNRKEAKTALEQEEISLQGVTGLLQDVKTMTISAGNGVLDDAQRGYYATELRERFNELLSLANSRDGSGNYLFAGFQLNTQPFTATATGASYSGGDQGQRLLQVGPARQLTVSDNGRNVFELIKTGNGIFVTQAASANTGTGVASQGNVVDSSLLTGDSYSIAFSVVGAVTTYNIVNTTASTTVATAVPFTSGQTITFDGLQFDVTGSPANGDTFTLTPSTNQSIFTTVNDLITALEAPGEGAANQARLSNDLAEANTNIDNALDNILTVRSGAGARLRELESLDSAGEDKDLQYASSLADLQELDYTKAISSLTIQQTILTAAQQSFVKTSNLSLFNFL